MLFECTMCIPKIQPNPVKFLANLSFFAVVLSWVRLSNTLIAQTDYEKANRTNEVLAHQLIHLLSDPY